MLARLMLLIALHAGSVGAFLCPNPAPFVALRGVGAVAKGRAQFRSLSLRASAVDPEGQMSRRGFVSACTLLAGGKAALAAPTLLEGAADKKDVDISDEELRKKLEYDVTKNQFMVTGTLTRSLYDEKCTFTDEIDTYTLDKWMQGTALLFKNDYSKMELDGPIRISDKEATFRFKEQVFPIAPCSSLKEQLMFNIPLLKPKVPLTGKLVLKRGPNGLFTSYKESWDQSVPEVLLSAKFF